MVLPMEARGNIIADLDLQERENFVDNKFNAAQQTLANHVLESLEFTENNLYLRGVLEAEKILLAGLEMQGRRDLKIFFFSFHYRGEQSVLQVCSQPRGEGWLARFVEIDAGGDDFDSSDIISAKVIDDDLRLNDKDFEVILGNEQNNESVKLSILGEEFRWNIEYSDRWNNDNEGSTEDYKEWFIEFVNSIIPEIE